MTLRFRGWYDPAMKSVFLVILTLVALYNPKVDAAADPTSILNVEGISGAVDDIVLNEKNPLKDIAENTRNYIKLTRIFKDLGKNNQDVAAKLLQKIQDHKTLSGDDLYLIRKSFEAYFKVNSKMLEFADVYRFKTWSMAKTFSRMKNKNAIAQAHLIWISSNILVMEQLEGIHKILYLTDGSFRRIFKTSIDVKTLSKKDKENLKQLDKMVKDVIKTLESAKFTEQLILVRSVAPDLQVELKNNSQAQLILNEILTNPIATDIAQGRRLFELQFFGKGDAVIGFFNKLTNLLSSLFGNIAGAIHSREGHLLSDPDALHVMKSTLRPIDIILEKSPFVLTDKFIPGHYGHVAIYLGTKDQLLELGMWDHPEIIPYQSEIEAGKTILEAVRPGVRLNTVDAFLNIDEYTILRKTDGLISPVQITEQITRGMNQIGLDYDFNFDISTLDKIVCSELIYIVYGHVAWPTRYRLGRPTITPDDIAEILFQKNTRFEMIDYVHSTKRHKFEHLNLDALAQIFEYELRQENGDAPKDPADPLNSFWKKETKCYNVSEGSSVRGEDYPTQKVCKTTYKQFSYEETSGF